jgi:hypothetical protein
MSLAFCSQLQSIAREEAKAEFLTGYSLNDSGCTKLLINRYSEYRPIYVTADAQPARLYIYTSSCSIAAVYFPLSLAAINHRTAGPQ